MFKNYIILFALINEIQISQLIRAKDRICHLIPRNKLNDNQLSNHFKLSCVNDTHEIKFNKKYKQIMQASMGNDHICIIGLNGRLECFKDDSDGKIDTDNTINQIIGISENKFQGLNSQIVSGTSHSCSFSEKVTTSLMEVYQPQNNIECQGSNELDQLKIPPTINDKITEHAIIKSGSDMSCAIDNYKILGCWGKFIYEIDYYQLYSNQQEFFEIGLDDTVCGQKYQDLNSLLSQDKTLSELQCMGKCTSSLCSVPRLSAPPQTQTLQLSVGTDHACTVYQYSYPSNSLLSLFYSFDAYCWGGEEQGQTAVPQDIRRNQVTVQAGHYTTCAIKKLNHQVLCWGKGSYDNKLIPDKVMNFYRQAVAGGRHLCALKGGILTCSGNNMFNQTTFNNTLTKNTQSLSAGWEFTCLISLAQQLVCSGINIHSQTSFPPTLASPKAYLTQVACGLSHSCAIFQFDFRPSITCWGGLNEFHQLDTPNLQSLKAKQVTVGDEHTCLSQEWKLNKNLVSCFGGNAKGQVDIPVSIKNNDLILNLLSAGGDHSCSYTYSFNQNQNQKKLQCWGSNMKGQLDVPKSNQRQEQVYALSSGVETNCAIFRQRDRGGLWEEDYGEVNCWGGVKVSSKNFENEHLSMGKKLMPVKITIGYEFICVVTEQGKLQCLGTDEENIFSLESRKMNNYLIKDAKSVEYVHNH